MKKYADAFLRSLTNALELIIAVLLAGGIIIMTIQLILSFGNLTDIGKYPNYDDLLTVCLNLIIGVEMIRMLYLHTPMTVFEVLLFAIARQIIIGHSVPLHTLIGVISIAILFATRKFLFVAFDESERMVFRASQKVRTVNRILHANIPYKNDESLYELLLRKMEEQEMEIGSDACLYIQNIGLRIAKMKHGKITRIEVIRSIQ